MQCEVLGGKLQQVTDDLCEAVVTLGRHVITVTTATHTTYRRSLWGRSDTWPARDHSDYCNSHHITSQSLPEYHLSWHQCVHQTTIQRPFTRDNPGKPVPELSETLTHCSTLTYTTLVCPASQALLTFPAMPPSLPLGSNTRENPADATESNMKNPRTRTHTSFILA